MSDGTKVVDSSKIWVTLLSNLEYLPGALTLDFSLKKSKTKYPFVVLYTDDLEKEALDALERRGIPRQRIDTLLPTDSTGSVVVEERFSKNWTRIVPFRMTQYERIAQLDADMLVVHNMDELMDIPITTSNDEAFAAAHACVCNPMKKPQYPSNWIPSNCAYTSQHSSPSTASKSGASNAAGLECNGGLLIIQPNVQNYEKAVAAMNDPERLKSYPFAEQSLLSDVFRGKWVPVPYVYNALKTLRNCHAEIWNDADVKNVHYILSPKPWADKREVDDELHRWWWAADDERRAIEKGVGIDDGL